MTPKQEKLTDELNDLYEDMLRRTEDLILKTYGPKEADTDAQWVMAMGQIAKKLSHYLPEKREGRTNQQVIYEGAANAI